jgi:hypothetical protein
MILQCADLLLSFDEVPQLLPQKPLFEKFTVKTDSGSDIHIETRRIPPSQLDQLIAEKGFAADNLLLEHDELRIAILSDKGPFLVEKDFTEKKVRVFYSNLYCNPDGEKLYIPDLLIANYRYLTAQMMVALNRIMLHGSALFRDGKVYVFLAFDGGGKSTLVTANSNFFILNDDQVAYSFDNCAAAIAWATPFGRISDGPAHAPIRAFFYIVKDDHFDLEPTPADLLIQSFWSDNQEMLESLPKTLKKNAFDLINRLSKSSPVYKMKCNYGQIDWEQIDRLFL